MMCQIGDSGGPLLIPNAPNGDINAGKPELDLVVGITSFGKQCRLQDPSVYASVGHHWDTISKIIKVPDDISRHLIIHYFMVMAE